MRKFTSLMLMLLCAVTTSWAQATILDRAQLLTNKNSNNQYEFTSEELIAPTGDFKKLRITFLESSNNEKPATFPCIALAEFYLYDKDGNAVTLTSGNFSSNATQNNEGSIEKICDGNTTKQENEGENDWYWHSLWSATPTPSPYGHHYLEIDLSEVTADLSTYKIGWVSRREQASPAKVVVSAGATSDDATKEANSWIANPTASAATMTEAKQITLYTIRSVRSKKFLYYVSDGTKPQQTTNINDGCYWYFTQGENGALEIRNAKTSQVLGNDCAMGASGQWYISPAVYRPGITIAQNNNGINNCIDDQSGSIGFWNHTAGDNEGTTWYLEEVARTNANIVLPEIKEMWIKEIGTAATSLTLNQWYVLNNVGRSNYVSQEVNALKMRATNNLSVYDNACDKAGYLFKLVKAADGEHYNLVSGNGFYFSLGSNSASVSINPVNYEIAKIGESQDNFYIFDTENNYAADGQDSGYNFVGWSNTIPTNAGGNDSYRLLPVTLTNETCDLTYVLTDNAGNKYEGSYTGVPHKDTPTLTGANGYTLSDITWNETALSAKINFIFPVSKVGETPNETMLTIWDQARYLRAEGNNIRVANTENKPLDLNALWAVYPSFENGVFKFTIKNIATSKYIYSEKENNTTINQEEGTVTLSNTPSEFVVNGDRDLRFADKENLYLSINGNSDTNVLLGVHNAQHGGTNIYAPDAIYNVTVTNAGYATFYASNAVTIPQDVKAYYITEDGINEGWVTLTEIANTIPAKTAVILEAAAETYAFNKTTDVDAIEGNLLKGTVEDTMIDSEAYVLGLVDGIAGLAKAKFATQFLNNHHKAYLPVSTVNGAAFYSFNFDWAGTTGIEGVTAEGAQDGAIYDITGRRVKAITAPGIYIVNGKKVVK